MSSRNHRHNKKHTTQIDKGFISKLVLGVAILEPLMTLPQIYQIWSTKNVQGVSLVTWCFYIVAATIWLFYGLKVKDKPVIITSGLWVIMEGLVVLGLVIARS